MVFGVVAVDIAGIVEAGSSGEGPVLAEFHNAAPVGVEGADSAETVRSLKAAVGEEVEHADTVYLLIVEPLE